MEFDDLKHAWEEYDRKLDAGIHLNTRILRSSTPENDGSRRKIDYSAPVVVVQKQLELLRLERSHTRKWLRRLASPACILLVLAGNKNLFGGDATVVLETAGVAAAVVFGLLAIAARIKRSALVSEFDSEEIVGKLQTTSLRLLRRRGVLRG